MNETGEKIYPWRTLRPMVNGSGIPVMSVHSCRLTFEGTPASKKS